VLSKVNIFGVTVDVLLRPVGGLGWTWAYEIDGAGLVHHSGPLLSTENAARDAAIAAAAKVLRERNQAAGRAERP